MSHHKKKTKDQLARELDVALKRLAQLEKGEAEHSRVKAAFHESEQRFRNIVQSSPMGIFIYELDSSGRLIFRGANPAAGRILGVDTSQFMGKTIEEAFPPLAKTEIPERYRRAAGRGESWFTEQVDYEDKQISGAFEVYAFQTQPNAMAAMFLDITERKRTEEALLFTRFSVDRTADAAFWMGPDGRFVYVNQAACRSLGYSKEELLELAVYDIDPNFPREAWSVHWQEVKKRGSFTVESHHRSRDGRVFPVEISVNYLNYGGREFNCAFARDITARKMAEDELKASEEKYRRLVELSNDAIFVLLDNRFELINEQFKKMFGLPLEEIERPGFQFMDLIAPKSRPLMEKRRQQMLAGQRPDTRYTFTGITREGKEIEIEASVTYIPYKDGIAVQGILRDISERQRMEEKLRQAQKMEAIGTLAGGIAHDFNNILMGIQGRVSLMLLRAESPFIREHLTGIEEYVERAAELTQQLLGFARGGKYEMKPIDLNALIKRSAAMFGRTKKEIHIHENYQPDAWTVEVDPGQIEQALLNLFLNAWQAMPGGGQLFLQTENINMSTRDAAACRLKPGQYVKVSVTDTGVGIDEESQKKIFDPFFTTKKKGRGTGLGLASVYGILRNHGGYISVYSEKGKGATFNIYLPASGKKPLEVRKMPEQLWRGSGTILFVDDEVMIIEVTLPLLEDLGYRVLVARSGEEAVEIFKEHKREIDLVILDMVMPDLGGAETFELLKELDPEVKVLLSSGYSANGQASAILDRGCKGFIQKPFDLERLSKKLKEILGPAG